MKRWTGMVAAALLCGLTSLGDAATISRVGIKGDDDRVAMDSREYPWSAVGRVNVILGTRSRSHCTGTLIGVDVVLTAAHCLYNPYVQDYVRPSSVSFVAGYMRGEWLADAKARQIILPDGFDPRVPPNANNNSNDWALLRLDKDLGLQVGHVGISPLGPENFRRLVDGSTVFIQAGYSADSPHILSAHVNCDVDGFFKGLPVLGHRCDILQGDSGSPLLVWRDGGFRVLGVNITVSRRYNSAISTVVMFNQALRAGGLTTPSIPRRSRPPMRTTFEVLKHKFPKAETLPDMMDLFAANGGPPVPERLDIPYLGKALEALR